MNRIFLKGRLGKQPENNNGVVKFSLATNDGYKKSNGEKVDKTNWHNIVAFGKQGEVIEKYVNKGDELIVEGRVEYNEHEGKYYTSIILNSFEFCGSKNTNSTSEPKQDTFDPPAAFKEKPEDDDLPF